VIRFCCEQCGHKISVEDGHTGKRGKCPECGEIFVVPPESTVIEFNCENCDRIISVPKSQAGKKAICPKCNNTFILPKTQFPDSAAKQNHAGDPTARSTDSALDLTLLDVPEEYKLKDEPAGQSNVSEKAIDRQQEYTEDAELAEQRKLPWIVDIFLYPFNLAGVIHLIGLWLLLFLLCPLVIACLGLGTEYIPIVYLLPAAYSLYYFTECIRDSAAGGRRAPNLHLRVSPAKPGRWDYISQLLIVVGSICTV
jgi:hypothetical protein